MVQGAQSSGVFIATDLASIAAADTADHGVEFTSQDLQVWDVGIVYVQCKVTGGNASNALDCVFKFVVSADGTNFTTEYFVELAVTMSGVSAIVKGWHLNVDGIHTLRLQQIENEEAVGGRTALLTNVRWGKSYGGY